MKTQTLKLAFYTFLLLIFSISCQKNDNTESQIATGQVQFGFKSNQMNVKSSSVNATEINFTSLIVSVEDKDGNIILNSKQFKLFKFNGEYISEPISLEENSYKLTKFLVIDSINAIYYATPIESGELTHLVSDPLPIDFSVKKDNVTKISPEVINVKNQNPQDFGVVAFDFVPKETFSFLIGTMVYNEDLKNYLFTDATISINNNNHNLYSSSLKDCMNMVTLSCLYDKFTIVITKYGYSTIIKEFSIDSLKACFSNPLILILSKQTTNINDGLLAYYPFDGNANDESGNHYNGVVNGAMQCTDRKGNINKAFQFNGNSNITVTSDAFYNSYYSFSLWFKPTEIPGNNVGKVLIDIGNAGADQVLGLNNNLTGLTTGIVFSGYSKSISLPDGGVSIVQVGTLPTVNTWYYITCTRSSDSLKIYINGVIAAAEATSKLYYNGKLGGINSDPNTLAQYNANTPAMYLGSRYTGNQGLVGVLDDIRIYNRVLSPLEVNALYNMQ